jgi:hypothetical protein
VPGRLPDDAPGACSLGRVKEFATYTVLRLLLFVATYAVLAALWAVVFGKGGVLLVPFLAAIIISSVLSLRLLAPQRERFAAVVEARATRATQKFEELKSREDSSD